MLIKVLDGCGINDRFWVFAAATTDVEYTLRVTDTVGGAVREYFNPLGTASAAITDSDAFATCPAEGAAASMAVEVDASTIAPDADAYTLRVTDTDTGEIKEYFNPLGSAAPAIIDTRAFASCS